MALNLVTGGLGVGKSYWMVRQIVIALLRGQMVVTNFKLEDHALQKIAYRSAFHDAWIHTRRRAEKLERLERNYLYVPTVEDLMRVRMREEEPYCRKKLDKHGNWTGEWIVKEGICRVFLDEAHNWLNAREWTAGDRREVLRWFTLTRKRGMEVYLGSQDAGNIDRQVRSLFEDHIKLNNLRRSATLLGIRVIPFNCFVALKVNAHYPKEISGRDLYILNWCKELYDTMDTLSFSLHGDVPEGGALWLPQDLGEIDDLLDRESQESGPASTADGTADSEPTPERTPPAACEDGGRSDGASLPTATPAELPDIAVIPNDPTGV